MPSETRFISNVIYGLRTQYGLVDGRLRIIREMGQTLDADTLTRTNTEEVVEVPAIILPQSSQRQFIARLANVVANREFSYGMWFDQGSRIFILLQDDLGTFVPNETDRIVWNLRRWEVQQVTSFAFDEGYVILGREIGRVPTEDVSEPSIQQRAVFGQTLGHTKQ